MNYEDAMSAANLIEILKACAHNTRTPLDELKVSIADPNGYAYWLNNYETLEVEEGQIVILSNTK